MVKTTIDQTKESPIRQNTRRPKDNPRHCPHKEPAIVCLTSPISPLAMMSAPGSTTLSCRESASATSEMNSLSCDSDRNSGTYAATNIAQVIIYHRVKLVMLEHGHQSSFSKTIWIVERTAVAAHLGDPLLGLGVAAARAGGPEPRHGRIPRPTATHVEVVGSAGLRPERRAGGHSGATCPQQRWLSLLNPTGAGPRDLIWISSRAGMVLALTLAAWAA